MFNAKPWLKGDAFDAVMNYRFARAIKEFFVNEKNKITSIAFADSLNNIYNDLGFEVCLSLQNLLDSHDVDRISSQLNNRDIWYDHDGNPGQNKNYNIADISIIDKKRLKLIIAVQMTLLGAPMIYYGDEAGMWGGDDPDCRKPMVWKEFIYENETAHPFHFKRKNSVVKFDDELFNHYKIIIKIRNDNECLSKGNIEFIDIDLNVLAYKRKLFNMELIVIANNQDKQFSLVLEKIGIEKTKNFMSYFQAIK